MILGIELGILWKRQLAHLVRVLAEIPTMQPGPDEQLLMPARVRACSVLSSAITFDRADIHEVEPTPDREARDVHLVEVL